MGYLIDITERVYCCYRAWHVQFKERKRHTTACNGFIGRDHIVFVKTLRGICTFLLATISAIYVQLKSYYTMLCIKINKF